MPTPRKMLGSIQSPSIQSLMELIETQSLKTLGNWAVEYVEKNVLPIYEKELPQENKIPGTIRLSQNYLQNKSSLKEVKAMIKEANQTAREMDGHPAAQAAARAVATACSAVYSPTSALGFTFYAAAAIVYDWLGMEASAGEYDAAAEEELEKILASLKETAVKEEPHPVKVKWNC